VSRPPAPSPPAPPSPPHAGPPPPHRPPPPPPHLLLSHPRRSGDDRPFSDAPAPGGPFRSLARVPPFYFAPNSPRPKGLSRNARRGSCPRPRSVPLWQRASARALLSCLDSAPSPEMKLLLPVLPLSVLFFGLRPSSPFMSSRLFASLFAHSSLPKDSLLPFLVFTSRSLFFSSLSRGDLPSFTPRAALLFSPFGLSSREAGGLAAATPAEFSGPPANPFLFLPCRAFPSRGVIGSQASA